LCERDQFFHHRAQFLRLRQRGDDLLVLDQGGRHVGEHGFAMRRLLVELAASFTVTHRLIPLPSLSWQRARTTARDGLSNDPRSAWRALRCFPAASPALPCRGG